MNRKQHTPEQIIRKLRDAERWLSDRQVCINYSPEDLEDDRQTLEQVFGPKP